MPPKQQPTAEGIKRYPPDGFFDHDYACTCTPACPEDCRGSDCHCKACPMVFVDLAADEQRER